jgi:hypothetical protein
MPFSKSGLAIAIAAILMIGATAAKADGITYENSGYVTGSIGGYTFTDSYIQIYGIGTGPLEDEGNGLFEYRLVSLNIAVVTDSGVFEKGEFLNPFQVFSNNAVDVVGFTDGEDVFDTFGTSAANYELTITTPFPIIGTPSGNIGQPFETTLGNFVLDSFQSDSYFDAFIQPGNDVPEPGSFVTMLTGLACMGLMLHFFRPHNDIAG